ncbi:MAG TPA: PAS domain S-box protein [Azospirillaceae bacterium]|nr:PAS domain S-box protein [Azospirillaceae bacterium]
MTQPSPPSVPPPDREALLRRLTQLEREAAQLRAALGQPGQKEAREALAESRADNRELLRMNAELEASRAALQESRRRTQAILDSATDYVIISLDPEGRITSWNTGAVNILGWEADEVIGQPIDIIFLPEQQSQGIPGKEMATALAEGRAMGERWHRRKDGSRFWAKGSIMLLGDDQPLGYLKILRDRTQEREAEEGLRTATQRTADILESLSEAFIAIDRDYRVTYRNRKAERSSGRSRDLALGSLLWQARPAAIGTPIEEACRRVIEKRVAVEQEYRFLRDGHDMWLEIRAFPTPEGAAIFYRDITARKRADEEREQLRATLDAERRLLQAILDQMPSGLSVAEGQTGRLFIHNEQAVRLLGHPLLESTDAQEHTRYGALHPDGTPYRAEEYPIARALLTGEVVDQEEMIYRRGDGRLTTFAVSAAPVQWIDGGAPLAVSTFHDISARKAMQVALQEAKEQAEQANLAKSTFLAAASHDLRQPLQSLLLFAAALNNHIGEGEGREVLAHLERGLDVMKALLDSLLDISHLDAGTVEPKIEDFAVASLMEQIQAEYTPAATAKGLRLSVVPSPATVRSDRTLLGRMIRNLVENALRYTAAGEVRLECRPAADRLHIEVRDTGIGIPPEHLNRIWDEFHQIGNPERDRNQGLGLGLAIVRRLSALLDHPVRVRSMPGKGSAFNIDVPLGRAPSKQPPGTDDMKPGNGRFAVLVDDDAIVLFGLQAVLQQWGYEVLIAGSTEQVLERLGNAGRQPDIIVADYRLREGRFGTEAILRIREAFGAEIPALLLTGEMGPECQRDAALYNLGIAHKPVTSRQLGAAIEKRLAGK